MNKYHDLLLEIPLEVLVAIYTIVGQ